MITAQGLRKSFGEVQAVSEVSLEARDGEITAILGPNGAGKSTTLRMLYGLIRPDAGSASVNGVDVQTRPHEIRRLLGVLPDAQGLYPRLTAAENIRYFGQLHGMPRAALRARMEEIRDLLGMGEIFDRKVSGFSQGERMKVALARALVHDPPNVLLDEPTNGLDVMSTRAMRELIRGLKEEGRCVIFSSHVMQEVAALADRVVIIASGRVAVAGTQQEILDQVGVDDMEEAFVRFTDQEVP